MKKIIGSVVLAVVIAVAGLPFAAATMTAPPHACCLAHGAHQCAETTEQGGAPSFSGVCPYHASAISLAGATAVLETRGVATQIASSPILFEIVALAALSPNTQPTGRAPPTHLL